MATTADAYSRYKQTPLVVFDGVETYGTWAQPSWLITRPDESLINKLVITSDIAGRPDTIAYRVYGVSFLDWAIIAFNKVLDQFGWPQTGIIIEYPVDTVVLSEQL